MEPYEFMKPPFPEEVFQLGKTYQLGEPQEQYGTNFNTFAGCAVLVVIALIGPVIAAGGLRSPQGILAIVIVLVVFSFALLMAFFQRKWRVYVYTDGFVYIKGRLVQALHWNEIELVRRFRFHQHGYSGSNRSIWIIRSKQRKAPITFGNEIYDIEGLMKTIGAHVEIVE
ncbi:hypothetical protein KSD_01220 [Ktedonobacter sp. SOSP1-85]|uniref:DUF6585 family protein n=1 Tax=Ktedonobacter sp. SOSP1-85 TaxID=2778367 RepID=UPI00191570B7|nr:DUF6585 family protein [Ktedonobacter sp. SOSP1-85]GHO72351.1 hypothetical protein KSD_01220 [Ktedonobacter sp. SOSP1-85]